MLTVDRRVVRAEVGADLRAWVVENGDVKVHAGDWSAELPVNPDRMSRQLQHVLFDRNL